jgi:hypothetical protein
VPVAGVLGETSGFVSGKDTGLSVGGVEGLAPHLQRPEHEHLATAYGLDITTDPAQTTSRQVRELTFVLPRDQSLGANLLGRTKPYSFIFAPRLLVSCKMDGA